MTGLPWMHGLPGDWCLMPWRPADGFIVEGIASMVAIRRQRDRDDF